MRLCVLDDRFCLQSFLLVLLLILALFTLRSFLGLLLLYCFLLASLSLLTCSYDCFSVRFPAAIKLAGEYDGRQAQNHSDDDCVRVVDANCCISKEGSHDACVDGHTEAHWEVHSLDELDKASPHKVISFAVGEHRQSPVLLQCLGETEQLQLLHDQEEDENRY